MGSVNIKPRLYGLDLYRIMCVFFVFLFHSNIHLGVTYSFLTPFISQSAIFMVAFFVLSGFSIYYGYCDKSLNTIDQLKSFYIKRIISLYPLYITVYILYLFLFNNLSLIKNIIILPIELLLIQSFFDGSFSILHNGGTWFISCIFFCYLLFPFLKNTLIQIRKKRIVLLCIIYCICAIAPVITHYFKLSNIYANPFFRALEFTIGMITASVFLDGNKKSNIKFIFCIIANCFIFVFTISFLVNKNIATNYYVAYNFISIPAFVLLLYCVVNIKSNLLTNIASTKIVQYLSKISYAFFLAQFFTWAPIKYVQKRWNVFDSNTNIKLFIVSFFICLTGSILMYECIDKPISKVIQNYLSKKSK